MDELFDATDKLLLNDCVSSFRENPLIKCFETLKADQDLTVTLKSGPDVQDLILMLLDKHGLNISQAHLAEKISYDPIS